LTAYKSVSKVENVRRKLLKYWSLRGPPAKYPNRPLLRREVESLRPPLLLRFLVVWHWF